MDREQVKKLLPIITAFAEGREIEINVNGWVPLYGSPKWDDAPENYRIKPEETGVVRWAVVRRETGIVCSTFSSTGGAESYARTLNGEYRAEDYIVVKLVGNYER